MDILKQSFWIPKPTLTEENLPDQSNRVVIITGGYAGVGLELGKILYAHNAILYIAGRSPDKAAKAIEAIKQVSPSSTGRVEFLELDLSDLPTIKPAADKFMATESRLDVLIHNAGVMMPPHGTRGPQGHEIQMVTNCLGPFLLTQCLLPVLKKTAASAPQGSVRVTWAGSAAVDLLSPSGGVTFDDSTGAATVLSRPDANYGQSKACNLLLAKEFAKRYPLAENKIVTNAWNPGNLHSELQRHMNSIALMLAGWTMYPPRFGAYTELFAGFSTEAGEAPHQGEYIWPWGRFGGFRKDIAESLKSKQEGGNGKAAQFWDWCEEETKQYM